MYASISRASGLILLGKPLNIRDAPQNATNAREATAANLNSIGRLDAADLSLIGCSTKKYEKEAAASVMANMANLVVASDCVFGARTWRAKTMIGQCQR